MFNSHEDALRYLGLEGIYRYDSASLKSIYRGLSKMYHPDSPTGSEESFKRLESAYGMFSGIEEGTIFDLRELVASVRVTDGGDIFSYIVNGVRVDL